MKITKKQLKAMLQEELAQMRLTEEPGRYGGAGSTGVGDIRDKDKFISAQLDAAVHDDDAYSYVIDTLGQDDPRVVNVLLKRWEETQPDIPDEELVIPTEADLDFEGRPTPRYNLPTLGDMDREGDKLGELRRWSELAGVELQEGRLVDLATEIEPAVGKGMRTIGKTADFGARLGRQALHPGIPWGLEQAAHEFAPPLQDWQASNAADLEAREIENAAAAELYAKLEAERRAAREEEGLVAQLPDIEELPGLARNRGPLGGIAGFVARALAREFPADAEELQEGEKDSAEDKKRRNVGHDPLDSGSWSYDEEGIEDEAPPVVKKMYKQDMHDRKEAAKKRKKKEKEKIQEGEKWIQDAEEDIDRRGTEGVCTGKKFGGPTCRSGTKRYNLAKTFRKMAKKRKRKGKKKK